MMKYFSKTDNFVVLPVATVFTFLGIKARKSEDSRHRPQKAAHDKKHFRKRPPVFGYTNPFYSVMSKLIGKR
jgi:hypothetical protein